MTEYRRFDSMDWQAFAGAECFTDGRQPFIYNQSLNSGLVQLTVIADRNGLEIYLFDDGDGDQNVWDKSIKNLTSLRAEGELKHLIEYLQKFEYAPDLAYELDHPSDKVTEGFEFN